MPTALILSIACALGLGCAAHAAPVKQTRTLVTDEQLAAWRADAGRKQRLLAEGPFRYGITTAGERPVGAWAAMSDDWLWNLMLPTTIRRVTTIGNDNWTPGKLGCPVHGEAIYAVDPYYPWIVDVEALPFKVTCPIGGETYPSNDYAAGDLTSGPYPDDGSGCVVDGKRYHFLGLYSHYAYNSAVVAGMASMARLYSITGDPAWAHKAGVLLLRVATEYPNGSDRADRTYNPGYGHGSGMVTDVVWSSFDLIAMARAYDEIFAAMDGDEALLALARERVPGITSHADLREYIEDHIFRAGMQALLDERILPNIGAGQETMAQVALMMNDYSDRHPNTADAMQWLYYSAAGHLRHISNQFYKDGSSYESTGYNAMRGGILTAGELVRRIKALAPTPYDEGLYPDVLGNEKVARFAEYQRALTAIGRHTICIGDAGTAANVPRQKPRRGPVRRSEWLDGYGLAILRDEADECNTTLFYGGVRGHAHYDPLMIGLFALGRDLLPNIGYPRGWQTAPAWEWSLATHMTVVVDRDEAPCSTVIGSLGIWAPEGPVKVMEASKRPYRKHEPRGEAGPDVTDYRRMIAQVDLPDGGGNYVLDIFRVTGGRDHLQVWHGPYTEQPVTVEGAALTAQPSGTLAGPDVPYGARYRDERGRERWDPYCHFRNVARGEIDRIAAVTWTPETDDPVHLRLNYLAEGRTELIRAEGAAPSAPEKDVIQWAFAHRAGEEGLRSQFVTLIEPYAEQRVITAVRRLHVRGSDPGGYQPLAIEVSYTGGRDLLLSTGSPTGVVEGEGFRLVGRFGFIRIQGDRISRLRLVAGTELTCGDTTVRLPEASRARIVRVNRATAEITVEGPLPPVESLPGGRILIDNHGERICCYLVEEAKRLSDGRALLRLDSSGNLGEGIATGFEDGLIRNGPTINMPFAGLVRMPDGRLDYSDCFHYGGHLENGMPGVSYKVRGVFGFPYQAWGDLHIAGRNHVLLTEAVPAAELERAFAAAPIFTIYEYGVGDEVWFDRAVDVER